jgi:hypothetical protein|tara:strand:+ start:259 stop:504 length:246 start_codon:yes stop_codon:yes gene_type:complete
VNYHFKNIKIKEIMKTTIGIEKLIKSKMERLDNWKANNPQPEGVDEDTFNQYHVDYQSRYIYYKKLNSMLEEIDIWKKDIL